MKSLKLPASLSKDVRYAEGYMVWLLNLAMLVGALIPADGLSTRTAAIIATVNTGLHVASARVVQVTALIQGLGIGGPTTPKALTAATGEVDKIATVITPQIVADAEKPNADKILGDLVSDESELGFAPPADPPAAPVETPAPVSTAPPAPPPETFTPAPAPAAPSAPAA